MYCMLCGACDQHAWHVVSPCILVVHVYCCVVLWGIRLTRHVQHVFQWHMCTALLTVTKSHKCWNDQMLVTHSGYFRKVIQTHWMSLKAQRRVDGTPSRQLFKTVKTKKSQKIQVSCTVYPGTSSKNHVKNYISCMWKVNGDLNR